MKINLKMDFIVLCIKKLIIMQILNVIYSIFYVLLVRYMLDEVEKMENNLS